MKKRLSQTSSAISKNIHFLLFPGFLASFLSIYPLMAMYAKTRWAIGKGATVFEWRDYPIYPLLCLVA